jgi:phosphonate degradation associated HDIG domain protein
MAARPWSDLSGPDEVAAALIDLYRERGEGRYDEVVTQTEHARQCAALALAVQASDATVVAALLHDIGHLLSEETGTDGRDRRHEEVGSRFLRRWFGPDVLEPIRLHVAAKRCLCALDPSYVVTLSNASIHSLRLQGGPMTPEEVEAFGILEHSAAALELRRWDDQAKDPSVPTPELEAFEPILERVLRQC